METVIYGMLQEEKQRNLAMQEAHKREINSLKKGSIKTKHISGRVYFYLQYRQDGKVKDDYIGKDESIVDEIRREIERRKYLESVLRRLKLEHRQICLIVKD